MKKIILLGASGSIGSQSLEVIREHPDQFSLYACSVGDRTEKLEDIVAEFHPKYICVKTKEQEQFFREKHPDWNLVSSIEGLIQLASLKPKSLIVLNALQGAVGFLPTYYAIQNGHTILLANKETLVMAGDIIMKEAKKKKVSIYPIDSEHSAIWQCIQNENKKDIRRIVITASGGAFREYSSLVDVTVEDALKHPSWKMGDKITIDCATMMNKGFEVIEAHHLFQIPYDKIDTILHYESQVHSFVEMKDSTVKAILGASDMKIPILIAMSYPKRIQYNHPYDFTKSLSFKPMDFDKYSCLKLAYKAGKMGGNMGVILNASNEAAVRLFLNKEIPFLTIERIVRDAMDHIPYKKTIRASEVMPFYEKVYNWVIQRYGGKNL